MARLTKQEAYDLGVEHGHTMAQESGSNAPPSDGWDALLINADPALAKEKFGWDSQDSDDESKELLDEYCKGCQAGANSACDLPSSAFRFGASKRPVKTVYKTTDGLCVYDLDPQASELWVVAGLDIARPELIDPDDLPEGFRWITNEEWEQIQTSFFSSIS